MNMNEKRVTELFLGAILLILLIILVFLFTNNANEKPAPSNSYVINSYNNYQETSSGWYTSDARYKDLDYEYELLRYVDIGKKRNVKGLLGNDMDKYSVYVRNEDMVGGYFTVRFFFMDYYRNEDSKSITRYILPLEEREFLIKDVHRDRYKNYYWDYEVISHSRI